MHVHASDYIGWSTRLGKFIRLHGQQHRPYLSCLAVAEPQLVQDLQQLT